MGRVLTEFPDYVFTWHVIKDLDQSEPPADLFRTLSLQVVELILPVKLLEPVIAIVTDPDTGQNLWEISRQYRQINPSKEEK